MKLMIDDAALVGSLFLLLWILRWTKDNNKRGREERFFRFSVRIDLFFFLIHNITQHNTHTHTHNHQDKNP